MNDTTSTVPDAEISYTLTADVKPQWLNVIRRLQSACHGNQGYAVLSIRILVNGTGEPVCWTEPGRVKVEPKSLTSGVLLDLAGPHTQPSHNQDRGDTGRGGGGYPLT